MNASNGRKQPEEVWHVVGPSGVPTEKVLLREEQCHWYIEVKNLTNFIPIKYVPESKINDLEDFIKFQGEKLDQVHKGRDALQKEFELFRFATSLVVEERDELKVKLEKAIACLKFYANWANYKDQKITEHDCDMLKTFDFPQGEGLVGGKHSRKCLEELGEG